MSELKRFTAQQAREISIDQDFVQSTLNEIYTHIRNTAEKGEHSVGWAYLTYTKPVIRAICEQLQKDGYEIVQELNSGWYIMRINGEGELKC